jgi:DNA-binding LytR/AlgR family response regulator
MFPPRIAGVRGESIIMMSPHEIRYAEADGRTVWLEGDHGRVPAAIRGFDNVERQLSPFGFLRVHRRYIVNVARVKQVDRAPKSGALTLSTDADKNEAIPVSRRHVLEPRRALGI